MSAESAPESSSLDERLAAWVDECLRLRRGLPEVHVSDSPKTLHQHLVSTRAALDRVEEIVVTVMRLKSHSRQGLLAAKYDLDESEIKAYDSRTIAFAEFSTAKEREAWVSTQTVPERAEVRRYTLLDAKVGDALEEVKFIHRAMDGVRRDADTRLRMMTFERQLER